MPTIFISCRDPEGHEINFHYIDSPPIPFLAFNHVQAIEINQVLIDELIHSPPTWFGF